MVDAYERLAEETGHRIPEHELREWFNLAGKDCNRTLVLLRESDAFMAEGRRNRGRQTSEALAVWEQKSSEPVGVFSSFDQLWGGGGPFGGKCEEWKKYQTERLLGHPTRELNYLRTADEVLHRKAHDAAWQCFWKAHGDFERALAMLSAKEPLQDSEFRDLRAHEILRNRRTANTTIMVAVRHGGIVSGMFSTPIDTPVDCLRKKLCNIRNINLRSVVFTFNGHEITAVQTPTDLGLEDGDLIELKFVDEHSGACP